VIRVRTDDVMVSSKDFPGDSGVGRFRAIVKWLAEAPERIEHVPMVLVKEIQEFPTAITFLKEQVKAGVIYPQVHGYEHVDYKKKSFAEIVEDLKKCKDWFETTLGYTPTVFATPWGASAQHIKDAARAVDMTVETTEGTLEVPAVTGALRLGAPLTEFDGRVILAHWWERGTRLQRLGLAARYGSWAKAALEQPEAF
jgi:peptidoglycan/xylan/chitin deacetylase (PgdA/CDA1 family)